ncbi:MAG: LamG-like jellyroll fold domain-containing protein, partial [Mucilaginibacter sp.]
ENAANKNGANGYAGLDGSGKVAAAQLPSYIDDVVEYTNFGALPFTGETGKIYVTTDNNKEYRWSGSTYIQLVASPGSTDAVAEGSSNLYFTAARVLATILTGIGFSSATAITATDSILGALGKLQAQFTALFKIPAGGTTGQVLAKVDDTDGTLEWINPPAGGGGGGYAARTFDEILTFDMNFKMTTTQTADIDFVLGSGPVEDVIARIIITGDGTHNCSFPSDWINANGQTFDNTKRNIIFLEYDGTEVLYSIIKVETPDVTAPVLVSVTIENTAKNKIVLSYSELLASIVPNISDYVINLGNVITGIVVAGSTVTIVCTDNFTNTDVVTVSYTPGTNKIQDAAGNLAAGFTSHAVVNNVSVENRSLSVLATNQIPGTTVVPSNLAFGSGGSGGSDTPFSIAFWYKDVAVSGTKIGFSFLRPGATLSCGILNIMTAGSCAIYMAGNGGINVEHMNINNTVALTRAVWNHIVFTYDGSKLLAGMKMYVNGTLVTVDANTIGTYNGQVTLSSDHQLQIGGGNLLGAQTIFSGGLMDEFYWFNKELSSNEVSELYNLGNIIDNPSSLSFSSHLKAGYKFDSNLTDLGSSSYDLSSSAAPTFSTDAL